MTIYEAAEFRIATLEKREKELQELVRSSPPGKLIWASNSKASPIERWYIKEGKTRYLPRKEKALALALLQKGQAEAELKDIASEKYGLSCLLRHPRHNHLAVFSQHLASSRQLALLHQGQKNEVKWEEAHYEGNSYPISKPHRTSNGEIVRSKSELLIAQLLLTHQIPYRYEQELCFGQQKIHPDFTILRPYDHKIIYWEHWGKIDDVRYRQQYHEKMELYLQNTILPDDNLICTYETAERPLDLETVEEKIQRYLLIESR